MRRTPRSSSKTVTTERYKSAGFAVSAHVLTLSPARPRLRKSDQTSCRSDRSIELHAPEDPIAHQRRIEPDIVILILSDDVEQASASARELPIVLIVSRTCEGRPRTRPSRRLLGPR